MFRVGLFTFGGGYAMLPQISKEFVDKHKLISEEEILDIFAAAQSLPGVIAVNASVLTGYRAAGMAGALIAALGATLPSFLVLIPVTVFYEAFLTNEYVAGALMGIRAAMTGALSAAVLRLGAKPLGDIWGWCLFLPALALAVFTDINVIWIILAAALAGYLKYLWERRKSA